MLMRFENFEEIWKIFTHFYPPLHHADPPPSLSGDEVLLQRTRCQERSDAPSCRLLPSPACKEPWSRTPDVPEWMKALSPAFDSSQVGTQPQEISVAFVCGNVVTTELNISVVTMFVLRSL